MINPAAISKILGFSPLDIARFEEAFTHKSFQNEHPHARHNERLEFLGDAVLELVVSEFLFQRFPDAPEGQMTKLRSALVNTASLAQVAAEKNFGHFLQMSRGEMAQKGSQKAPALANVFEAFIGALYLEGGLEKSREFLQKTLFPRVDHILEKELHVDPKSAFQEWAQAIHGKTPRYEILREFGLDHEKTFVAGVFLEEEKIEEGTGSSKQKAEISAAKNAMILITTSEKTKIRKAV